MSEQNNAEEMSFCRYCSKDRPKSDMKRLPLEAGKTRNVVRMACTGCYNAVIHGRERASRAASKIAISTAKATA